MHKKATRGRPAFKPTADQRRKVEVGVAFGMAHDDIALALGIARGTLLKYFDQEISVGAARRRMEVLTAMHRTAIKGNVAAQKALMATVSTGTVPKQAGQEAQPAAEVPAAACAVAPTPPMKALGKKEEANRAAVTAGEGTEWAEILRPAGTPIQ